jgi:hypothetical protein
MQRDTHTEAEVALEAGAAVEPVLLLVVPPAVVAWSEQLEATVPMQPSSLAGFVLVAEREPALEPAPERMAWVPHTVLVLLGLAVVVHMLQPAVVESSTAAEAIL